MKKNITIIGSGWASSSFIQKIDTDKYNITVISPNENFIYTPLLANNIKNKTNLDYNINELNKIKYHKDEVINIDFLHNKIITKNNESNEYDYLILSHGSVTNTFNIEGVKDNCYFIKNVHDTDEIRNKLNKLPSNAKIAVIGCGLTGSEIIGTLIDYNKFNIYAIDGLKLPLTTFTPSISTYTLDLWKQNNINSYLNNFVSKIDNKTIYFKESKIDYDMAIWCGGIGISPLSLLINKKLGLSNKFGIPVNNYLQVNNTKNVYAMGDCAYSGNPPTAQVAYQQGKYLANNFNNRFENISLAEYQKNNIPNLLDKPFNFKNKGQICYIGKNHSVYQNNFFTSTGLITGYLHKFIHFYHGINLKQSVDFLFSK